MGTRMTIKTNALVIPGIHLHRKESVSGRHRMKVGIVTDGMNAAGVKRKGREVCTTKEASADKG
jgi:hypothetical protein